MGARNIVKVIKQYQEKWLQHVQRMDTNRIPKQALQYKPKGRRHIGRPRKRWRDHNFILRIKEQESNVILPEHDDDDDDRMSCKGLVALRFNPLKTKHILLYFKDPVRTAL
jgi:hypothetical protein